jgi:hypothetical protein
MLLFEAKQLLNFVGLEVEALRTYGGCSLIFVLIFVNLFIILVFNKVGEFVRLEPWSMSFLPILKKKKNGVWYLFRNDSLTKKD